MESFEVLKSAINKVGAKTVAFEMSLSTPLIYKWCQENNSPDSSGADNPLDRLMKIYEITGDDRLITWLCEQAGGFMVQNPDAKSTNHEETDNSLFGATQKILKEFSELLDAVSTSYSDDSRIDRTEAANIRREWEQLKRVTEKFVVSCEEGRFNKKT